MRLLLLLCCLLSFGIAQDSSPTSPDSTNAPTQTDTPNPDALLTERLETIYETLSGLDDVTVTASDGVVELSGETANAEMRTRAVAIAEGLDETVYVVDNLTQETNLRRTLSPAVDKMRGYLTDTVALLPLIGVALLILLLAWYLAKWISSLNFPYKRIGLNPLLQTFIRQAVRLLIFLIGLLLALDVLGATPFVTAILGTAGVAGVALGFAFRDIVENYLAGILMSARQPFKRGDLINIAGNEGKVIRMTTRELVLMTRDGNHLRIPNATVFTSELINYSRNPRRRFMFLVGVDVAEDLNQVQKLGVNTLRAIKGVLDDPPPQAFVQELGDFSVIVQFTGWVDQREAEFMKVKSQAIRVLKESFDAAGVLMPEPITNVRLQEVPGTAKVTDDGFLTSPEPPKKMANKATAPSADVLKKADEIDVSLESYLDKQIAESEADEDEPDLLDGVQP